MSELLQSVKMQRRGLAVAVALALGLVAGSATVFAGQEDGNINIPTTPTSVEVEVGCPPVPGSTYPTNVPLDDMCQPITSTSVVPTKPSETLPASL